MNDISKETAAMPGNVSQQVQSSSRLKIATQKSGRLADKSRALLERCGIKFSTSKDRLFCFGENMPVDLLLVRDDDIPGLLLDGVCDLGIVGQNVVREALGERRRIDGAAELEEITPLDFGGCRLSFAVPETVEYAGVDSLAGKRIATSYPEITREYLADKGVQATIVKLSGSVEIAPSLGTADAISDLVSTGSTLRANHLVEVEIMMRSTAALYASGRACDAEKTEILDKLLKRIQGVLQVRESKYVMLHAPRAALAEIKQLLPGAESPTVLPLEGETERVAIHAVCRETVFWEHLEELKAAGASAVLVLPVEKMLA